MMRDALKKELGQVEWFESFYIFFSSGALLSAIMTVQSILSNGVTSARNILMTSFFYFTLCICLGVVFACVMFMRALKTALQIKRTPKIIRGILLILVGMVITIIAVLLYIALALIQ